MSQFDLQVSGNMLEKMQKQQYRFVGNYNHTAVKTCGWTKNMIRGEGGCYKLKFYGIMSHQCLQMTPSISCANRCSFCWRDDKAKVSKDWVWGIDDPIQLVEEACQAHHKLLNGFKGNPKANKSAYKQSNEIKHVALSLTGEPITYPRLNEMVDEYHKQGISTFLVTNATYPEHINNLHPVTQLYISLDAPNKKLLKDIDKPVFEDYWERLFQSLDYMAQKKYRTTIRLTMIKELNMIESENYSKLIRKGNPDFIEIKAYMWIGASQKRLTRENMPLHEEVVEFSKDLIKFLPEYEICSEHIPSRVVMLAKKVFKQNNIWHTWIDFPKFLELSNKGLEIVTTNFLKRTPTTGLSGKGTLNHRKKKDEDVVYIDLISDEVKVDESTPELEFYFKQEDPSADGC
ncbi:MAG: S-adenosyl-L-methionine-dependent tRNA 4-demethylwyosine synthase [Candidatus Heimdallarchaeota archaeon LC_3]|nr:MAG: S-adenosyl-L-methionine-dependent tRNA 4-demethylwyosine synthase [Candidatus Heimdallarchaeota archaeon LC_3]